MARLAADLRDFLDELDLQVSRLHTACPAGCDLLISVLDMINSNICCIGIQNVTVVGTSMGASTIWSYTELFGDHRLAKAVFVDQAPLQVRHVFM